MKKTIERALRKIKAGEKPDTFYARFFFDAAEPFFAGHFPEKPLLPGFMQIEMAKIAFEKYSKTQCEIAEIMRAKFSGQAFPDIEIELFGQYQKDGEAIVLSADIKSANNKISTIRMRLGVAGCRGYY